jgi:hypothetical protein
MNWIRQCIGLESRDCAQCPIHLRLPEKTAMMLIDDTSAARVWHGGVVGYVRILKLTVRKPRPVQVRIREVQIEILCFFEDAAIMLCITDGRYPLIPPPCVVQRIVATGCQSAKP